MMLRPFARLDLSYYLPVICIILAAAFAVLHLQLGLTNDNKVLLFWSLRLVDGSGHYAQGFETNPPLIMLLYAPAALVVMHAGLAPEHALFGYALLLCAVSLYSCRRVLASSSADAALRRCLLAFCVTTLLILPITVGIFADREHLMFALSLPWLLRILLGESPGLKSSLAAAVGFFIKPHNLVIPLVMILAGGPLQTLTSRLLSPSTLIMSAFCLIYLLSAAWLMPHYFNEVLPLLLSTYSALQQQAPFVMRVAYAAICAVLALALTRPLFRDLPYARAWYGFIGALLLVYLLNSRFHYTDYFLAVLFSFIAFIGIWRYGRPFRAAMIPYAGILLILLGISLTAMQENIALSRDTGRPIYSHYNDYPRAMMDTLNEKAGARFVLLSTSLWGTDFEELGAQAQHIYRFDTLWPMPWVYMHPGHDKAAAIIDRMAIPLAEALNSTPAPTLIVDASPVERFSGKTLDMLSLFRRNTEAAEALEAYRHVKTVDYCAESPYPFACRFTVWKHQ